MSFLVAGFGITFFQGSTGVKFSDVAGIDDAVDELQEVILLSRLVQQLTSQKYEKFILTCDYAQL